MRLSLNGSQRLRLAVLLVLIPVSLLVVGREVHSQSRAAKTAEISAGRKFKNIKVLREMPADQLGKVMNIMTASLGVGCSYCHAGYDFEKDTNPKKEVARRMLRMTFELNRQYFSGKPVISCNTCHNGSPEPTARPSLNARLEAKLVEPNETKPPTAAAVIDRYERALGTSEARARIQTVKIEAERIEPDGTKEPEEVWLQFPDKMLVKTTYPSNFVIIEGFDGQIAWKTSNGAKIDLKADEIEQIRQNALVGCLSLSRAYPRLAFGYSTTIDGSNVYVLIAESANGTRDELSFDVATGFLLRRESSTRTVLGDFVYRVDFSDYREFGGVKVPLTFNFAMPGVRWTRKILTVKVNLEINETNFDAPV